MSIRLAARTETWPLKGSFAISRGAKTETRVVVVEVSDGGHAGRGECVPYPRYDETVESVLARIEAARAAVEDGAGRLDLLGLMPAGAARNAIDCALWGLGAKRTGRRVWELAGLPEPAPLVTAYTLGLDAPAAMAEAARAVAERPLLKLKLAGEGALERVAAVHAAAPAARLIVDAKEAWTAAQLEAYGPELARLGVEMIEQPLPAADDAALAGIDRAVPVCADESCHTAEDVAGLADRYDLVNVKLDKTGGLTGALDLARRAGAAGLGLMVGCMVGTSLSMAPAVLVAQGARVVDLDGPLLLREDRRPGLRYDGSLVAPPERDVWG